VAQVVFNLSPPPDLVPIEIDAPPVVTGPANPVISLAWRVTNQGLGPSPPLDRHLLLSSSASLDWQAKPILTVPVTNSLLPSDAYWQTNTVTLPLARSGSFFLLLQANSDNGLFEDRLRRQCSGRPILFDFERDFRAGYCRCPFPRGRLIPTGGLRKKYRVQYAPGLHNLLDWVAVSNFTLVSLPAYIADPQAKTVQQRFYRIAALGPCAVPPSLTITRTTSNALVILWPSA